MASGFARHDRTDQGEGRDRFIGLDGEAATAPFISGDQVLTAVVTEMCYLGYRGLAA